MYKASIENRGDSRSYATTRHGEFVLDTEGNGSNPVDTLLASLCGCLGHYVRDYLRSQQFTDNGFSISAEAGTTADKASLANVTVRVDLKEVVLDDRQSKEILQNLEKCKVRKLVEQGTRVDVLLNGCMSPRH